MGLKLRNRPEILFILALSVIIIIDSNTLKFFNYTYKELPVISNVWVFSLFFVIVAALGTVLMKSMRKYGLSYKLRSGVAQRAMRILAVASQLIVIGLTGFTIFQLVFLKSYSIHIILSIVFSSFVPSIFYMILLVKLIVGWFTSSRNLMLTLYAISFSIICMYLVASVIYISVQFTYYSDWIKERSLRYALSNFPASDLNFSFGIVLDCLSLLSFLLLWIATVPLLRQYRKRIGNTRFWITISIPLIYFLFPFQTYFPPVFQEMLAASPILFTIIYLILFSATKQVGGILFSVVFLTAAKIVNQQNLHNYLLMTAIGIAVVYSSIEINSLLYAAYPPYGIMTIMLMPLGSYFLFNGLMSSARLVSQDRKLRKEFLQTAEKQLSLLREIGTVQMEKELEKSLKLILRRSSLSEDEGHDPEEEEVRAMVREVIYELRLKNPPLKKYDNSEPS